LNNNFYYAVMLEQTSKNRSTVLKNISAG